MECEQHRARQIEYEEKGGPNHVRYVSSGNFTRRGHTDPDQAKVIKLYCCDLFDYYRHWGISPLSLGLTSFEAEIEAR